jgi:TRAP-type C4-dicarboxylate transport system permease small subunit
MELDAVRIAAGRALGFVARACRTAAILLLALMSVLVITQVIGRNAFDLGMPWADELARFCGISLVFLAAPLLALRGQHIAVDIVPLMLPPRARRAVAAVAELSILIFCAFTLYGFYAFLSRAGKFATPAIGIPNWLFYAPALTGFVLLALVTIPRLAAVMVASPQGEEQGKP